MSIFNIDSPLMKVLNIISNLVIINLLTVLFCIPIFTAGAAFTALHYCSLKIVREGDTSIVKQYFHSFKDNFRQATAIWFIFIVAYLAIAGDCYLMYSNPTAFSTIISVMLLAVGILLSLTLVNVFAILARFCNTVIGTIKTAFIFAMSHFLRSVVVLILSAFPLLLAYQFEPLLPIFLFFCFSLPTYVAALLYNKPFLKLENRVLEEHPVDTPDEDEHIFSDTIIVGDDDIPTTL